MKTTFTLAALLAAAPLLLSPAQAQNVGIGTATPDPSAALDIRSAGNNQGFLPPCLTYAQRLAISNAAAGLLVYQSDDNASPAAPAGYYFYSGTQWLALQTQGDNLGNHTATQNLNLANRLLVGGGGSSGLSINAGGNVGIGPAPNLQLLNVAGGIYTSSVIQQGGPAVTATTDLGLYSLGNGRWMRFVTNSAPIRFYTDQAGGVSSGGGSAAMSLEANGNLGLGPQTALAKFDIQSGSQSGVASPSLPLGAIAFSSRVGGYRHWIYSRHDSQLSSGLNALDFYLNNSSGSGGSAGPGISNGSVLALTLAQQNGQARVGVGTSAPQAPLHVQAPENLYAPNFATSFFDLSSNSGQSSLYALLDGNATTAWQNAPSPGPHVVQHTTSTPRIVRRYSVMLNLRPQPFQWELLGSNDNSTFTVLDTRTAPTAPITTTSDLLTYDISNTVGYRYYRLRFTAGTGGNVTISPILYEWRLQEAFNPTASLPAIVRLSGGTMQLEALAGAPRVVMTNASGTLRTAPADSLADNLGNHSATQNLNLGSNLLTGGGSAGLRVDASGNVGIGTSAPSQALEVAGTVYSSAGGFRFPDGSTQTTAAVGDNLGSHTATQNLALNGNWLSNDGGNAGLRIDNSGNVGIGTAATGRKLSVAGQVGLAGDTRRGLGMFYNEATGDAFGLEQVSTSQTGHLPALRIYTSSVGGAYLSFGKYTSATSFSEFAHFANNGRFTVNILSGSSIRLVTADVDGTLGTTLQQRGQAAIGSSSVPASRSKTVTVTFPVAYPSGVVPLVNLTVLNDATAGTGVPDALLASLQTVSNTGFTALVFRADTNAGWSQSPLLNWVASQP